MSGGLIIPDKETAKARQELFGISEQLDTISRRSVIKEIDELLQTAKGESEHDLKMLRRVIKDMLPSAQPERKKGEWIIRDNPSTGWYRVTCSECGDDVTSVIPMIGFFPNAKANWDFCPNCGADMRGEQDDSV